MSSQICVNNESQVLFCEILGLGWRRQVNTYKTFIAGFSQRHYC